MRYQPIENHGIVGNMHSAALVSLDGSVDWLCLPRFDSPSVFGAILDAEKGGRFRIAPAAACELRQKQYYWPETNVLVTRFLHPDGIAEVEDYMPVGPGAQAGAGVRGDHPQDEGGALALAEDKRSHRPVAVGL